MGGAGALLVFTGFWHVFEWAMHGRNKDTMRLIPVGILYVLLGWFIVTNQFMPIAAWIALVLTAIGMTAAYVLKNTADMPKWVTWAFIVIDALIVIGLLMGLLV